MLNGLIQSLFFLCLSTTLYGMENPSQKKIVRAMRNQSNEKLINWDLANAEKATTIKIQPLPDLKFHSLTIKTNHARKQGNENHLQNLYKKISPQIPHEKNVLSAKTETAYTALDKSAKELAKTDITTQIHITEHLVNKCVPLFDTPEHLLATELQETKHALELFDFLYPLAESKTLITPDSIRGKIAELKHNVSPSVSYLLHACRCLQAVTPTEKAQTLSLFNDLHLPNNTTLKTICQFLINYGDENISDNDAAENFISACSTQRIFPSDLAKNTLYPHIITKLSKATFANDSPSSIKAHCILAELYYQSKDYKNAHIHYAQLPKKHLSYMNLKAKCNAIRSYLAGVEIFGKEEIEYYTNLIKNNFKPIHILQQDNPQLSYNVGLFAQTFLNHGPQADTAALLITALVHLQYAQQSGALTQKQLIHCHAMQKEFHTLLTTFYQNNNQPVMAIRCLKDLLENQATYNNNQQDIAVLSLLSKIEKENSQLYKENAQTIATTLQLIYDPHYHLITPYTPSDMCEQFLPYLEHAYTTNKQNKSDIAYVIALLNQYKGDYLKAYNYKRLLPQTSFYKQHLTTGVLSVADSHDAQSIIYALSVLEENKDDKNNSQDAIIKPMCLFIINELSLESFIQTVISQKDITQTCLKIADSLLCPEIVTRLENTALTIDTRLSPAINCILAELYYRNNNKNKAHQYYCAIQKDWLSKDSYKQIRFNAMQACMASTITFDEKTVEYISTLCNNIAEFLKNVNQKDAQKSHNIAQITQALLKANYTKIDHDTKIELLINALNHLAFAQKDNDYATKNKPALLLLGKELNTELSAIYQIKEKYTASLKHAKNVLLYNYASSEYEQEECAMSLYNFLDETEQNSPKLYNQYAHIIKSILNFIDGQQTINDHHTNYQELLEFASCDLSKELLSYCALAYTPDANVPDYISYLLAFDAKNSDTKKAYTYINNPTTIADEFLPTKATIYAHNNKTLTDDELEAFFKSCIKNDNVLSKEEQWTITKLINESKAFFIQANNYTLALKLIAKYSEHENMFPVLIGLAYHVEENLLNTKSSNFKDWQKELVACKFYTKIKDSSHYKGVTNYAIGFLLTQEEPVTSYAKIIEHFTAALESNTLPDFIIKAAHKACANAYYNWALLEKNEDICKDLFNKALDSDDNDIMRYNIALFILNNFSQPLFINQAAQLLEQNIQNNSSTTELSQIALGQALCHYNSNPDRIPLLQKSVNFDFTYALNLISNHDITEGLLMHLIDIFAGKSTVINDTEKKEYIDTTKELECINVLLTSNNKAINKQDLLTRKITLLLSVAPQFVDYKQLFDCIKHIRTGLNSNLILSDIVGVKEHLNHIISSNIITENAVLWSCLAAHEAMEQCESLRKRIPANQEQKDLANYLLSAAEKNDLNAQLTVFLYFNAIDYPIFEVPTYKLLHHSHAGLINPKSGLLYKEKCTILIKTLQNLVENGFALPYYILCDVHKNDRKKLEEIMMLFSKVKDEIDFDHVGNKTVMDICFNCKEIFMPYIDRCTKNQKKPSLMDTLVTFTFAAMCQNSNDEGVLKASTAWLLSCLEGCKKFKQISHLKAYIDKLAGSIYYKKAFMTKPGSQDYLALLKHSAELNYIPAAQKLAEIYIDSKNPTLSLTEDDFLPGLLTDIKDNPKSLELYEKILRIKTKTTVQNAVQNKTIADLKNDQIFMKQIEQQVNFATQKNMIKDTHYTETSKKYTQVLQFYYEDNFSEGDKLLQQIIKEDKNHPAASLRFASRHLSYALSSKNYDNAKKTLSGALKNALIKKTDTDATMQFRNYTSLDTLLCYIKTLLREKHPIDVTHEILQIIKTTLESSKINLDDFCQLFQNFSGIDLKEKSEWVANSKWTVNKITDKETCAQLDSLFKPIENTPVQNKNSSHAENIITACVNKVELLEKKAVQKDMIKYPDYEETVQSYMDVMNCYMKKEFNQGDTLLQKIIKDHKNHSYACLRFAMRHLDQALTTNNYDNAQKTLPIALKKAFAKKTDTGTVMQFHCFNALDTLFHYIKALLTHKHPTKTTENFCQLIKRTLESNGINMTDFCELFKDFSNINLEMLPEWVCKDTRAEKETCAQLDSLFELAEQPKQEVKKVAVPSAQRFSEIKTMAQQKNMVKNIHYVQSLPEICEAANLILQNKHQEAIELLRKTATKNKTNPCINMSLAFLSLKCNPPKSADNETKALLENALNGGIIAFRNKKSTQFIKQFHNPSFVNMLIDYMEILLTGDLSLEVAHELLSIIKQRLEKDNFNLDDFCELFHIITAIDLAKSMQWTHKIKAFNHDDSKQETEKKVNELFKEANITTSHKSTSAKNNEIEYTETYIQKNLIKDRNYKESSPGFLAALKAYKNKQINESLALMYSAATNENHPSAWIYVSLVSLRGDGGENDITLARTSLDNALICGLSGNQFCTQDFFSSLCSYIKEIVNSPITATLKQDLLSIIYKALIDQKVDLTAFYAALKELTKINLPTVPEWIKARPVQPQHTFFSKATERLVKNLYDPEITPDYMDGLELCKNGSFQEGSKIIHDAAEEKHIPSAYFILATNYFLGNGVTQDYAKAESYLSAGCKYGLEGKQFYSNASLSSLINCIDIIIKSQNHLPYIRKHLLWIIKKNLSDHNIDLSDFYEIVHEKTNIILSLNPFWLDPEMPVDQKKIQNNFTNSMNAVTQESTQKQQPIINDIRKRLIKDPYNTTVSPDYIIGMVLFEQGEAEKCAKLMEKAAINQQDPCCCISTAANYLMGTTFPKNTLFAEQFLQDSFIYGLSEKQFCNSLYLETLYRFIEPIINSALESSFKRNLLSIIKKNLIIHHIPLNDFYLIVQKETKINLCTTPEWNEAEQYKPFDLASFIETEITNAENEFCNKIINDVSIGGLMDLIQHHNQIEINNNNTTETIVHPQTSIKESNTQKNNIAIKQKVAVPKEQRKDTINKLAPQKNMVKNIHYVESFDLMLAAVHFCVQKESQKAIELLRKAIKVNRGHTCIHMALACEMLGCNPPTTADKETKILLENALTYGITASRSKKGSKIFIKQFDNALFLHLLFDYMEILLTDTIQLGVASELLHIIKDKLEKDNFNLDDFCDLFHNITAIDLANSRPWRTKIISSNIENHEQKINNNPTPEKKQLMILGDPTEDQIDLCSQMLECFKTPTSNSALTINNNTTEKYIQEKKSQNQSTIDVPNQVIIDGIDLKFKEQEDKDIDLLDKIVDAHQKKNREEFIKLARYAIKEKNNPSGYIYIAGAHLTGIYKGVEKNYSLSEQNLCRGLALGLQNQEFCSVAFFQTLCGYIASLHINQSTQKRINFLTIIRKELEKNNVNLEKFCIYYKKLMDTDLSFSSK